MAWNQRDADVYRNVIRAIEAYNFKGLSQMSSTKILIKVIDFLEAKSQMKEVQDCTKWLYPLFNDLIIENVQNSNNFQLLQNLQIAAKMGSKYDY